MTRLIGLGLAVALAASCSSPPSDVPHPDTGNPVPGADTGLPFEDAGTVVGDAGADGGDAGVTVEDGGTTSDDAGSNPQTRACKTDDGCPGTQSCPDDQCGACVKKDPDCKALQACPAGFSCGNGIQDNGEGDIDCGGPCPFCTNELDVYKCKDKLDNLPASQQLDWKLQGDVVPTKDTSSFDIVERITGMEPGRFYKRLTLDFDMHVGTIKGRYGEGAYFYDSLFSVIFAKKGRYGGYFMLQTRTLGTETTVYWAGQHSWPADVKPTRWTEDTDYHVTLVFDAGLDSLSVAATSNGAVKEDFTFSSFYPIGSDIADTAQELSVVFPENLGWRYSNVHAVLEPGGPFWGGVRMTCGAGSCTFGQTQDCVSVDGCPGTQECSGNADFPQGKGWLLCRKKDPTCGLQAIRCGNCACDPGEDCSTCPDDCGYCGTEAACSDKRQDGEETGVDCGDICSRDCASSRMGPLRALPTNPRFFTGNGVDAVYFTGFYWGIEFNDNAFGSKKVDFDAYLDFLQSHDMNFVRLWIVESTAIQAGDPLASPMPFRRVGPGKAKDGGLQFDVDQFDDAFLQRLAERVGKARDRGIYVSVLLFDKWSAETSNKGVPTGLSLGHPFAPGNNVNNISTTSPAELRSATGNAIRQKQDAYVKKVIDTVNGYENVLYEIANEEQDTTVEWQYHMIELIHQYEAGKPQQHPVGMSAMHDGTVQALLDSGADYVTPILKYSDEMPINDGKKVIILDTDHLNPASFGEPGHMADVIWKGVARGHHLDFLGAVTNATTQGNGYSPDPAVGRSATVLGKAGAYLRKMNLGAMVPSATASSTQYCLASDGENVAYNPVGGPFTFQLPAGTHAVEWFDPMTGSTKRGDDATGGSAVQFTPPKGYSVLYLTKK